VKLFSPGGFKGPKIPIFVDISRRKHLRAKRFRQKIFLIEFYMKKVTLKIFVECKEKLPVNVKV
jgi:hypothetical protein